MGAILVRLTRSKGFQTLCVLTLILSAAIDAKASKIIYDLSGESIADIDRSQNRYASKDAYFKVNWEGAVLTHDTKGTSSFADDVVSISGEITACVGFQGTECSGSGKFRKRDHNSLYIGEGTFEFIDVEFGLDASQTTNNNDLYAKADADIGKLQLTSQRIPQKWKPQQKLKGDVHDVLLGLKENENLGYAFRLFDEDPTGDGLFRISSWIMTNSYLFAGTVRLESLPIEDVFNGDIFACRRGMEDSCFGGGGPMEEVPEPSTIALVSMGLLGSSLRRRRTN